MNKIPFSKQYEHNQLQKCLVILCFMAVYRLHDPTPPSQCRPRTYRTVRSVPEQNFTSYTWGAWLTKHFSLDFLIVCPFTHQSDQKKFLRLPNSQKLIYQRFSCLTVSLDMHNINLYCQASNYLELDDTPNFHARFLSSAFPSLLPSSCFFLHL